MRTELLDLIRIITNGIVADEALAVEVSKIAEIAQRDGRPEEAEALRVIARNRRIRVLELQARLAALDIAYVDHQSDRR